MANLKRQSTANELVQWLRDEIPSKAIERGCVRIAPNTQRVYGFALPNSGDKNPGCAGFESFRCDYAFDYTTNDDGSVKVIECPSASSRIRDLQTELYAQAGASSGDIPAGILSALHTLSSAASYLGGR